MKIDYSLAQLIVSQTIDVLGANVSVADEKGVIVASGDRNAVGSLHAIALRALQCGEPVEIALSDAAQYEGVREGICLPLTYDGRRVGVIVVNDALDRCRASCRVVQALSELLIHQTTVIEQLPLQKELRDKFIHDLFLGGSGDEDTIIRQGQVLGMDLTLPRVVILVDASRYILNGHGDAPAVALERDLHERRNKNYVVRTVVDFFHLPSDTICAYVGEGRIAVLKSVDGQDPPSWGDLTAFKETARSLLLALKKNTGASICLGVGRYHPGFGGLAKSYHDALLAIDLGTRLIGTDTVHCLDSLGAAALVGPADHETRIDLATHLLKPLDEHPELLHTLELFLASDCAPSHTADALGLHRNTLGYRLAKIQTLTGLDPRRFEHAVQLHLAALLRRVAN